jgi:hypothetical protein
MSSSPFSFGRKSIDSLCQSAKQRLRHRTKPHIHDLVLNAAMDLTRSKQELVQENMLLRQQLIVLNRQLKRPALSWRDRTLVVVPAENAIRSGISRSAPMSLLGAPSDRELVTVSTHLRSVALAHKRQKGLPESNLQLLLPIGLPFAACIR